MDGASHFFDYGIQGPSDGSYQVFDGARDNGEGTYPQHFTTVSFPENVPTQPAPLSARPMQPPPLIQQSLSGRTQTQFEAAGYVQPPEFQHQRRLSSVPNLNTVKLEPSRHTVGSGSSVTETRVSGQIIAPITPNITPPEGLGSAIQPSKPPEALFPPPAPLLPRRRRPRKPRPKPQLTQEQEEEKREKFLARNRAAAGKCRVKRKTWMTDLEDTKMELEEHNSRLRQQRNELANELNQTRAILMVHANCSDSRIDKWIENEAKRYVLGAGEQYDSLLANFGMALAAVPRNDSLSSMSEYTTATNELMSPTQRGSFSMPRSMSPRQIHRGSVSLPPGMGMPDSPVFYRPQSSHDPNVRPMPTAGPSYLISPPTQPEDPNSLNSFSNFPGSMI
ncbi:hypothetical protein TruAng_004034 [Truncatella angustata]|nr:hypothetical protein TruAng_004034 [Truncatella angustata]